jgi:hypothetical protein
MNAGDIITVESDDGVLHEMVVQSVNQDNRTVTGEVATWPGGKERGKIVETVTVPDHAIVEGK